MKSLCIEKGNIEGYEYRLEQYSTHYCAYVGVSKEHPKFNERVDLYWMSDNETDAPCVHRGLSYSGKIKGSRLWYLGWDYGHYCDLIDKTSGGSFRCKKPSREQYMEDIKECVAWLKRKEGGENIG
jgi:hypothetical protein